jgi:arylsulfatase A-like enzyme
MSSAPGPARPRGGRRARARLRVATGLTGVVLLCAGMSGCSEPPPPPPLSMLIVTLDTTRVDALSCYGLPFQTTAVIDALAGRGIRFTRAYAPMSQTLAAHASLFTGQPPRVHGASENYSSIRPGVATLAELLRERGYATGAFVACQVVDDSTGLQRGFEIYDQVASERFDSERPANEVTDVALACARGLGSDRRPRMLWAHYFDAHGPYEPAEITVPVEAVRQWVLATKQVQGKPLAIVASLWHHYLNEVAFVDRQVGRLLEGLESLGWMDHTIVVVAGDHGEGFYEHGDNSHALQVTEEHMRVPFVLALPDGELAGTTVDWPVLLRDITPTLLSLSRAGVTLDTDGLDLAPALRSRAAAPVRPVFLERPHCDPQRFQERFAPRGHVYGDLIAVIVGDEKLVRQPDGSVQL